MKIDVTRKIPDRMDCIIVLHQPGAKIAEIGYLPASIVDSIDNYVRTEEYDWAYGSMKSFHHQCSGHNSKIILLGTGEESELNANKLRNLMATGFRQAKKIKASQVFLFIGYKLPVSDVMLGH
ncbi:MAG: M17 family peptidase N-terminal domain-containing protein, partial [Candidatus Cloacimonadota bacterium]